MSVFDEINALPVETVLSRLNLRLAKDGKSYVCPLCDNGATGDPRHGHGDGIKSRNSKGRVRWKCHKCGVDFSNFDLAAATLGLDAEHETAESARRVAELFGIPENKESFSFFEGKKSARTAWTPERRAALSFDTKGAVEMDEKKSASDKEPKNYAKFYEVNRANVDKFLVERGGSFRGLTAETFKKYGLAIHPDFGVGDAEKCPHVIIPYDDYHFFARAIVGHARSQHGANSGLYEPLPIKPYALNKNFNFIVESELDALSIAQVLSSAKIFGGSLSESIGCVATGGATKYEKVVPLLEKRFGNAKSKPACIVMFDNDENETGNDCARKLVFALKAAGYPAECFFLEKGVDANDLLRGGEDKLFGRLIDAIEQTENSLNTQAEAILKSAERALQATLDKGGIKFSSFAEYFSSKFWKDISLTEKYSSRKTGFANIDASAQVFMPGLYLLGGLPATGKTTFAWQLLNQLALNGSPCIYCSYEMSEFELFTKSITRETYVLHNKLSTDLNLSSANIRRGACKDVKEFQELVLGFSNRLNMNLSVAELSNTGIAELIEELKPRVASLDKGAVICIDYLQKVPSKGVRTMSTKEKIDYVMLRLKDFQRETNSTVIVISSFNRENYGKEAKFSSFKESGEIEYSADVIWALANRGADYGDSASEEELIKFSKEPVRHVKFSCIKNRNGLPYNCRFRYYAAYDYFKPCEEEAERPRHGG